MKPTLLSAALLLAAVAFPGTMRAQDEGVAYCLPKTAAKFTLKIEKTTYTPGDFAEYAQRFLRVKASTEKDVAYRIIGCTMDVYAEPDTARRFVLKVGDKRGIGNVALDDKGILLAVNDQPMPLTAQAKAFVAAPKSPKTNPRDYLSQEILAAGSNQKMAELTAQDIYDIRDSRNQLSRGQADYMPKDGEQLKLMLQKLDTQEAAMLQLFTGTTECDTSEVTLSFVPIRETNRQLLFRFSKRRGVVDIDDLGGNPYYISVEDEHSVPAPPPADPKKKKDKEPVMYSCTPGRIRLSLFEGATPWHSYEMYAAQFGQLNPIDEDLINKKVCTMVVLNPYTGGVEKIKTEPVK